MSKISRRIRKGEEMKWNKVLTWTERCEKHPDHKGIVTNQMIQDRMQEEIDELRRELKRTRSLLTRKEREGL